MDKIRKIIRLNQELNLGCRKIAQALSISKTAVNGYLVEFRACGLSYRDISNLTPITSYQNYFQTEKETAKNTKSLKPNFPTLQES